MSANHGEVFIQPVLNARRTLWYYEWFAGLAGTDWHNPMACANADASMLNTLSRHAIAIRSIPVGVNISFFTAAYVGAHFVRQLAAKLPPRSIVEITEHAVETASGHEMEMLRRTCAALRDANFVVALDDCSVGHPFGDPVLWRSLSPHIIKLDLGVVEGRAVAPLAHREGLKVICEAVESTEDEGRAIALRADGFQGYLFGHPEALSDHRHLEIDRA